MSTILKALRRLEEDKTSQIRQPLGEPSANPAVLTRGRPWLVAVVALSAGIALGAAALLLLPRAGMDRAPRIAATPASDPEIPVPGLAVSSTVVNPTSTVWLLGDERVTVKTKSV